MKHSKLARAVSVAFILGCFLPGYTGLFFRQSVVWGLFLFGWACIFMHLAFYRTLAKPEQSTGIVTGALKGNWVFMLNISFLASAVMHAAIVYNPDFLSS